MGIPRCGQLGKPWGKVWIWGHAQVPLEEGPCQGHPNPTGLRLQGSPAWDTVPGAASEPRAKDWEPLEKGRRAVLGNRGHEEV